MITFILATIVPMPALGGNGKIVCRVFLQAPTVFAHIPLGMGKWSKQGRLDIFLTFEKGVRCNRTIKFLIQFGAS
ncbi:hypothetical protein D3C81_1107210 [compost metagenome]